MRARESYTVSSRCNFKTKKQEHLVLRWVATTERVGFFWEDRGCVCVCKKKGGGGGGGG